LFLAVGGRCGGYGVTAITAPGERSFSDTLGVLG
jgi:hypothetical protein